MNPEEPSADEALRAALAPPAEHPESDHTERQDRLKSSLKVHTVAHDAFHFLVKGVTSALGWIVLTLWSLAAPGKERIKPQKDHRNEDR